MSSRIFTDGDDVRLRSSSVHFGERSVEIGDVSVRVSGRKILIVSATQFSDSVLMQLVNEWACYEGESARDLPQASTGVLRLESSYAAGALRSEAVRVMSSYATDLRAASLGDPEFVMFAYGVDARQALSGAAVVAEHASHGDIDDRFAVARRLPLMRPPLLPVSLIGTASFERPCAIVTDRAAKLNIEHRGALDFVAGQGAAAWKIVNSPA